MAAHENPAQPGTAQAGLDVARSGWFTELSTMWKGQGLSFQIEKKLFQDRSDFQDICVFQTQAFGKVLVLDGVIQCTEKDEFAYQEMIAHLPLCGLAEAPKKVLVVGGGDGGVLREVARHDSVTNIHIAEIDGVVVDVAKQFFPQMAVGFSDPRVQVHITDGIKYVQEAAENSFDVIIVDSSDPVGPAEVLFQKPFFEAMHRAVRPGGMVCTQAESLWLHLGIIKELAAMCHSVFQNGDVRYGFTTIPTYPSGQIGFLLCTKSSNQAADPRTPKRKPSAKPIAGESTNWPELRYYNAAVHQAAFALPQFAVTELASSLSQS